MYVLHDGVYYKDDYTGTNCIEDARKFDSISEIFNFISNKNMNPKGFSVYEVKEKYIYAIIRKM